MERMIPGIRFRHFVEIARMASFRKAAKYLDVEQSAVAGDLRASRRAFVDRDSYDERPETSLIQCSPIITT